MNQMQKLIPMALLAGFVFLAALGGWQVLQRFEGVRVGLPVEELKWHRGVSSLIQGLGDLTEKLGVAQAAPTSHNLNQLTMALDGAFVVEQALRTDLTMQDRMGTRAVRKELKSVLSDIERLLESSTAFDQTQAQRQHSRLIYLSNELETAYLAANERAVTQLHRQGDLLSVLKADMVMLLGLIAVAIGIVIIFLMRARTANLMLQQSRMVLEEQQRSLNAANEKMKAAQRLAQLGSWSWDIASGEVVWSEEACRIYGYAPGTKASFDAFMQAVHPDDREKVQAAVTQAQEKGTPYILDHRVICGDGTVRYVQEQGGVTYGDDGAPLRMDGTVLNITDLVRSEQATRDSEQRFRSMVENAGDAIYIHDRYGKIYDVNQVACEQTGYNREELLSLSVAQLDAAIDFENLRETWDLGEADPDNYPLTLESAHRRKDGTVFPMEVRISLLPSEDQGYLFVAMVRDITERKQVEQELEFQKSALDQHAIVSIADVKGDITYVNDKFCSISGYSREELVGNNHRIVKSEEHSREFYQDLWRTIASGKTWRGEICNLKKGGEDYYWVDASIVPFLGEDGKPFQYVAIRTDITERVRAKQEAETANRAKSEFLSSMSHELRTPLNAICGFSQLLETDRKNPLTDKQIQMVEQISKGGQHLLSLINDILDLAKIEAGKLTISLEDVAPWDTVSAAMNLMANMGAKRNVRVALDRSIDCPSCTDPCTVRVDQSRFRQVLLNLLSNAVKYNRDGGSVTLTCSRSADGGYMRFTVSDTGMGVPQSLQSELFTPFNRLGAESGEIEGTGIGLTITKTLTELMGGEIGFTSQEGEGSQFWVEFPLAGAQDGSADVRIRQENTSIELSLGDDAKRTVLYIEDNPANLQLMEMIFDRLDSVRMISAHTAELGLEIAERERPDLILMDINLPGMNGVEALKQLQSSEALRKTPVVAVSANAMKTDIDRALQVGFKGYITKPFEVDEIIQAVSDHLK